jgi:hypothetical protein
MLSTERDTARGFDRVFLAGLLTLVPTTSGCDATRQEARTAEQGVPPAPVAAAESSMDHEQPVRLPAVTFHIDRAPSFSWLDLPRHPLGMVHHPTVVVLHEDLPGQRLALRAPEDLWLHEREGGQRTSLVGTPTGRDAWQQTAAGGVVMHDVYRRTVQGPGLLELELSLVPMTDGGLALELVLENRSSESLGRIEPVFCLTPAIGADQDSVLARHRGARSWVRTLGLWRAPDSDWSLAGIQVQGGPDTPAARPGFLPPVADIGLIVRENEAEGWSASLGWTHTISLSTPSLRCIHAHPDAGPLEPGAQVTRTGVLRLEPEGRDALLEKHLGANQPGTLLQPL